MPLRMLDGSTSLTNCVLLYNPLYASYELFLVIRFIFLAVVALDIVWLGKGLFIELFLQLIYLILRSVLE